MYMKYLFSKLEETNLRFTKKATFYLFKAEAYISHFNMDVDIPTSNVTKKI